MYYAFIENDKINGIGQCPCEGDGIRSVIISEEIYNNIEYYMWDGSDVVLNPNYEKEQEEKEKERIAKLSLTKREVFLALYKAKGLTPEMIRSQITDTEALIEFDYATEYFRFNHLIDKIGLMLGYSSEDIDYLFENKQLPEKEEPEPIEESEVE